MSSSIIYHIRCGNKFVPIMTFHDSNTVGKIMGAYAGGRTFSQILYRDIECMRNDLNEYIRDEEQQKKDERNMIASLERMNGDLKERIAKIGECNLNIEDIDAEIAYCKEKLDFLNIIEGIMNINSDVREDENVHDGEIWRSYDNYYPTLADAIEPF